MQQQQKLIEPKAKKNNVIKPKAIKPMLYMLNKEESDGNVIKFTLTKKIKIPKQQIGLSMMSGSKKQLQEEKDEKTTVVMEKVKVQPKLLN